MKDFKSKALSSQSIKQSSISTLATKCPCISKLIIPKPLTNQENTDNDTKVLHLEQITTNNSPASGWLLKNSINMLQADHTVESNQQIHNNIISKTNDSRDNIEEELAGLVTKIQNLDECKTIQTVGCCKNERIKKKKLINLKSLYKLLIKIFLNRSVSLNDLRLKDYELYILSEILIRKNRRLSLTR